MTWRRWVLAGGAVVVVAIVVAAVFVLRGGGSSQAGAPAAADLSDTATSFLAAWSKGDVAAASALTDDPAGALAALKQTRGNLTIDPQATLTAMAGDTTAKFHLSWTFGQGSAWSYDNTLKLV